MVDRGKIHSETLRELYDYWRAKHRGARLPARADIDPIEIPSLLADIALLKVLDEGEDFVFDLAGTRIEQVHGRSLKGVSLSELRTSLEVSPAIEQYREVARDGEPRSREGDLKIFGKEHWSSRRLLLPLSSDGKRVDTILAGAIFWPAGSDAPDS
ncbi:MAG: PAS domain-containing protein [Kiloniellales bacterium]